MTERALRKDDRTMIESPIPFSAARAAVKRAVFVWASIFLGCVLSMPVTAQDRDAFEQHVRPMLIAHCIKCHGETKQEGGLRLTSIDDLYQGGDSGPAIVAQDPDQSLLIEALRHQSFEMPPSGQLPDETISAIANWIQSGAAWPEGLVLKPTEPITEQARDWWCYQPLNDPQVPEVDDNGWCRNEIDRFVFDRLSREQLAPSPEAEPAKLVRRVHYSITGLPPDETAWREMKDRTVGDGTDWYESMVDQLLNDSAYGEHQAMYWLDLVRYADSDGYNADHARPDAHLYRDYVIRSFNEDKPYDRFVFEQIAGDEVDPGNRDALIGTMYLRHWIYEHNQRDVEGQWAQILNDVTETTADVFLAQGLKCARCHDHKFDPLLQQDYYALRAFFTPLTPREDQPIGDVETRSKFLEQQRIWEAATEELRKRIHELETPVLLAYSTREKAEKFTKEIQAMLASRRQDLSPYERQIATLAAKQFDVHPDKLPEWLDEAKEAERQQLRAKLAEFDHLKPQPLPTIGFVASDVGPVSPPTTIPGAADTKSIEPAFPIVLGDQPAVIEPPHESLQSTGRRTTLARWIASEENPLTARVIVNRIWQQHFGRGLVESTSDFGHLGTPPSHPELLDWLAQRFIEDGWSLKKLHRRILTSAAYRQSSERPMDDHIAVLDPQNVFLWRMNARRLSGEEIHDAVISASGEMGPGKSAIYKPVKRNALDPLLAAFDFPDRVESQCKRHCTTTSPQSLLMMNDPWLHERAKKLATDIGSMSLDSLVQTVYQRLYFRQPSDVEIEQAIEFVQDYEAGVVMPEPATRLASMPGVSSAIDLTTERPVSIHVAPINGLYESAQGDGDFTIEATVMLRSLYPDASVRTIVACWADKHSERGWSLGVTSTKSAYKPLNLILQLVGSRSNSGSDSGSDNQGKPEYEVIASGLRLELNKPYSIAVTVDLDDASEQGITFYLTDLSVPGAQPQISHAAHLARSGVQSDRVIEIGGRSNHHLWDGLIGRVALHQGVRNRVDLFPNVAAAGVPSNLSTAGESVQDSNRVFFDVRFADDDQLGHDVSGHERHALIIDREAAHAGPAQLARIALLHALLCSNEVIYVD